MRASTWAGQPTLRLKRSQLDKGYASVTERKAKVDVLNDQRPRCWRFNAADRSESTTRSGSFDVILRSNSRFTALLSLSQPGPQASSLKSLHNNVVRLAIPLKFVLGLGVGRSRIKQTRNLFVILQQNERRLDWVRRLRPEARIRHPLASGRYHAVDVSNDLVSLRIVSRVNEISEPSLAST